MKKSIYSERYRRFLRILVKARKAARITQSDLAKRLQRPQSFISKVEHGERRLDVIEFLEIARVLRIEPTKVLASLVGAEDR